VEKGVTEPREERSEQPSIISPKKWKQRKKGPSIHQRFLFNRGEAYHLSLGGGGGVGVGAAAATATRWATARVPS